MKKIIKKILNLLRGKSLNDDFFLLKKKLNTKGMFKNLIVFDVGAHHGLFSMKVLNNFPSSEIYAFEPSLQAYSTLMQLAQVNKKINCYRLAVGASSYETKINLNKFDETNSIFHAQKTNSFVDALTETVSTENIKVTTLDEQCAKLNIKNIDLLKIDVQGSELNVLKGAQNLLKVRSIKFIYCEVEFIEIYKKQPLVEDIIKYLRAFDYLPILLNNLNYTNSGHIGWCDILFEPNETITKRN